MQEYCCKVVDTTRSPKLFSRITLKIQHIKSFSSKSCRLNKIRILYYVRMFCAMSCFWKTLSSSIWASCKVGFIFYCCEPKLNSLHNFYWRPTVPNFTEVSVIVSVMKHTGPIIIHMTVPVRNVKCVWDIAVTHKNFGGKLSDSYIYKYQRNG
jgi:hypothetical protein